MTDIPIGTEAGDTSGVFPAPSREQTIAELFEVNSSRKGWYSAHIEDLQTAKRLWEEEGRTVAEVTLSDGYTPESFFLELAAKLGFAEFDDVLYDFGDALEHGRLANVAVLINVTGAVDNPNVQTITDNCRALIQSSNSDIKIFAAAPSMDQLPQEFKTSSRGVF